MNDRISRMLSLIFFIVGASFLLPVIVMFIVHQRGDIAAVDRDVLIVLEWVFGALAAGFCIAAVIIWAVNRRWRDIIAHLKATGERYEAEITKVYDNLMMRVNFRNPIIVECIYKNRQGQSVLVKSKNIWPPYRMFDRKNIKAAVWVNPSDARDYYVEVFFGDEYNNDPQADYDFR